MPTVIRCRKCGCAISLPAPFPLACPNCGQVIKGIRTQTKKPSFWLMLASENMGRVGWLVAALALLVGILLLVVEYLRNDESAQEKKIVFVPIPQQSKHLPAQNGAQFGRGGAAASPAIKKGQGVLPVVAQRADANRLFVPDPMAGRVPDSRAIVEKVSKAVVTIETDKGLGSGVILDARTIATNYHVIFGAESARVVFADKTSTAVTRFWGILPACDVIMLSVDIPPDRTVNLPRIAPRVPEPGAKLFAFGSPRDLRGSVTDGIVSAIRLAKDVEFMVKAGYQSDSVWIQMTVPISPGNSGGPVVDANGEIVGLSTITRTDGQNLNFAVSSMHISSMLNSPGWGTRQRSLSELPKPDKTATRPAMPELGKIDETLQFWNEWAKLRTAAKSLPQRHPKTAQYQAKFSDEVARAYLTYAARVTGLRATDVDPTLAKAAIGDSKIFRNLGEAFGRSAHALRYNDKNGVGRAAAEIEALNRQVQASENYLADLRVWLSKAYATDFPPLFQKPSEVSDPKSNGVAERASDSAERTGGRPRAGHPH